MSHNTHSTVGQIAGQVLYAPSEGIEGNCKMQNAKCKLKLAIGSPLSALRSPRTGISLTEVLIAMGILTVGLLGVAAIFPVAGFYMQKGEVADRGSALAQSAFNELLTRGLLNPELWRVMVPTGPNEPSTTFTADTKGTPAAAKRGTFTRPFAAALREAQVRGFSPQEIASNFGGGFVIDPIGVNAFAAVNNFGPVGNNALAAVFPSSTYKWFLNGTTGYPWSPWSGQYNSPLKRVTYRDAGTGWELSKATSNRMFRSTDDLSLELPVGQDKPSQQPIDLGDLDGDRILDEPLARRSRGDYSWLATVMPSTPQGLIALANGAAGQAYEVSVVVFHKRVLPIAVAQTNDEMPLVASEERMARAQIVSTGLSGGEVLLTRHDNDDLESSPFDHLKTGNWIILCGPHPSSTDARPLFVARWYRILSIEKESNGIITDPANQRMIAVRGPQWPWQPSSTPNDLSNNLCVGIIPGAVAVHAKTINIEGQSVWSGGAEALNTVTTNPRVFLN